MKTLPLSSDIGMRTDAQIDRKQVYCPNVPFMGYNTRNARKGYYVVWNDDGKRRLCRVAGRVAYAPECGSKEANTWTPAVRNHLMLACLNSSASSIFIRWVNPKQIEECFSPADWTERMRKKFDRFTSDEFMRQNPYEIAGEIHKG